MDVYILFSWDDSHRKSYAKKAAHDWGRALAYELDQYRNINATCEEFQKTERLSVSEQVKSTVLSKGGKILVILSTEFLESIKRKEFGYYVMGLLEERIKSTQNAKDVIFIQKSKGFTFPCDLVSLSSSDYSWVKKTNCIDLSWINATSYNNYTETEKNEQFSSIVRSFGLVPEKKQRTKELYHSRRTNTSFSVLFPEEKSDLSLLEQEQSLFDYVKKQSNSSNFISEFIKSGPAKDRNLFSRMTPGIFKKHFYVSRKAEDSFNKTVNELFQSSSHNKLCLRAGRGSGKSVFVNMMSLRDQSNYQYTTIMIDFASISRYSDRDSKELLLFQTTKKWYRQMCLPDCEGCDKRNWRHAFKEKCTTIYNSIKNLADASEFFPRLKFMLENIMPEEEDRIKRVERESDWFSSDWKKHYYQRISNSVSLEEYLAGRRGEYTFELTLLLLLLVLDSMPEKIENSNRFLLVFDNVESFDNGERASMMLDYVKHCNSLLERVFTESGYSIPFFKKFTFVIVIRTSTFGLIEDRQDNDTWNNGRYIINLEHEDFELLGLIKKLKYLSDNNLKDTVLYKGIETVLSLMLPTSFVNKCLNDPDAYFSIPFGEDTNGEDDVGGIELTTFAAVKLLPFFNCDFRRTMDFLCSALFESRMCKAAIDQIKSATTSADGSYDYRINIARALVLRLIYDQLNDRGVFSEIGFQPLPVDTGESTSITRSILSTLYWNQTRWIARHAAEQKYMGIPLTELMGTFKYFIDREEGAFVFSRILFALSIYSASNDRLSKTAKEWTNLIIFETNNSEPCNSNVLSIDNLQSAVRSCINDKPSALAKRICVKLSAAGICFVRYHMHSFEFLSSRMKGGYVVSLAQMNEEDDIVEHLTEMLNVLKTCVYKLIGSCEESCNLYKGGRSHTCVFDDGSVNSDPLAMFKCSLFIRCQECSDLIRDAIGYIDRFRVVKYYENQNRTMNDAILDMVKKYYGLFGLIKDQLKEMKSISEERISQFISRRGFAGSLVLNDASKKFCEPLTGKCRRVQEYYVKDQEDFTNAIELAKANPYRSIFSIIKDTPAVTSS